MQQFSCVDVDDYAMMQKRTRGGHKTIKDVEKITGDVHSELDEL